MVLAYSRNSLEQEKGCAHMQYLQCKWQQSSNLTCGLTGNLGKLKSRCESSYNWLGQDSFKSLTAHT